MKAAAVVGLIASLALASGALSGLPVLSNSTGGSIVPFECEDIVDGPRVEIEAAEEDVGVERRMEIRAEADSRVRVEVRAEERTSESEDRREARVELCGFVEFADADGDGMVDASEVVRTTMATFESLEHTVEDGAHVFVATSTDGTLTVTARVPTGFPAEDEPLVRWAVEASPTCGEDATHFAVKLEQRNDARLETFLAAECGSTLTASGEA